MEEKRKISIKAKDDDLKGNYSNVIRVSHTKEEFCLDFLNVIPPQGILVSRIILSPAHFKRFISTLQDNLQKYEQSFGKIKVEKTKKEPLGFN